MQNYFLSFSFERKVVNLNGGTCRLLPFPLLLYPSEAILPLMHKHLYFCWSQSGAVVCAFHQVLGAKPHFLQLTQNRVPRISLSQGSILNCSYSWSNELLPLPLHTKKGIAGKPNFHKFLFCFCGIQGFYPNELLSKWWNLHHRSSAICIHA